jgi:hypothetical protein
MALPRTKAALTVLAPDDFSIDWYRGIPLWVGLARCFLGVVSG